MRDANILTPSDQADLRRRLRSDDDLGPDVDAVHPTPRWILLSFFAYLALVLYGFWLAASAILTRFGVIAALLLILPTLAAAQAEPRYDPRGSNNRSTAACETIKPGADWVCVNGGWLPPGLAPTPAPLPLPPIPPPPNTANPEGFKVGKTYQRDATGTRLFMVAIGAGSNGLLVLAAECLNEGTQDQCYYPGQGRFILANANTLGWTVQP